MDTGCCDWTYKELQQYAKENNLKVKRGGKGVTKQVLLNSILKIISKKSKPINGQSNSTKEESPAEIPQKLVSHSFEGT